jgi:DNA polymerase IIIc chi subunit
MTRIDFHTNVPDKVAYACRLVRKAWAANNRVVLLTNDARNWQNLTRRCGIFRHRLPAARGGRAGGADADPVDGLG